MNSDTKTYKRRVERAYFDADRFAHDNVKVGETFSVDSGLGGSYTVVYRGLDDQRRLVFRRCRSVDWPTHDYIYDNPTEASRHIFILRMGSCFSE